MAGWIEVKFVLFLCVKGMYRGQEGMGEELCDDNGSLVRDQEDANLGLVVAGRIRWPIGVR